MSSAGEVIRRRVLVSGVVQGVGFRPYVHGLARRMGLAGWVRNDPAGVTIEVQGDPGTVATFVRRLRGGGPPLARIESLHVEPLQVEPLQVEPPAQGSASTPGAATRLPTGATPGIPAGSASGSARGSTPGSATGGGTGEGRAAVREDDRDSTDGTTAESASGSTPGSATGGGMGEGRAAVREDDGGSTDGTTAGSAGGSTRGSARGGDVSFVIRPSATSAPTSTLIAPDVATCADCLAEIIDPADRRFGHAFANCTNCGPRYSLVTGIPYDRPNTTMASFAMCDACRREYDNPTDRRFHAQPVCCPHCGPTLSLSVGADSAVSPDEAVTGGAPVRDEAVAAGAPARDEAVAAAGAWEEMAAAPPPPPTSPASTPGQAPSVTAAAGASPRPPTPSPAVPTPAPEIAAAARALRRGEIVGVKGVGGYHLCALASDEAAVAALRSRKHREAKPFAIMAPDLASVRRLCIVSQAEEELLSSPARPIVLLTRRADALVPEPVGVAVGEAPGAAADDPARVAAGETPGAAADDPARVAAGETPGAAVGGTADDPAGVAASVAPNTGELGVMLPYTPLHHLLLGEVGEPIVCTSGNLSDEPIAYVDADAERRLGPVADRVLAHDRRIHTRVEDSVARIVEGRPYLLRRSRGYAPAPVRLPPALASPKRAVLACGADLKNTVALAPADSRHVFVSQHIGDLADALAHDAFEQTVTHLQELFEVEPAIVAFDLHPQYLSSSFGRELAGLVQVPVQHHHAHIAACLIDAATQVREGAAEAGLGGRAGCEAGAGGIGAGLDAAATGRAGSEDGSGGEDGFRAGHSGPAGNRYWAEDGGRGAAGPTVHATGAAGQGREGAVGTRFGARGRGGARFGLGGRAGCEAGPGGVGAGIGPVIGVAFDGMGYGLDGTIWGGEFLVADLLDFERRGYLAPVPMPGGDAATRQPWRMAASYLDALGVADSCDLPVATHHPNWADVVQLARSGVRSPLTSSAGRLFDAVAALLDVRYVVSYEGQAACELEQIAHRHHQDAYPARIEPAPCGAPPQHSGISESPANPGAPNRTASGAPPHRPTPTTAADTDPAPPGLASPGAEPHHPSPTADAVSDANAGTPVRAAPGAAPQPPATTRPPAGESGRPDHVIRGTDFVAAVLEDLRAGVARPLIAARFHRGLARSIVEMCGALRDETSLNTVALTGGCFANMILLEATTTGLRTAGFDVLRHRQVPCNDGGISLGQAAIAIARDHAALLTSLAR